MYGKITRLRRVQLYNFVRKHSIEQNVVYFATGSISTTKKLKLEDPKYAHDYNLIEYTKEHSMTIVTKDGELAEICKGNNFLLKPNF
jgi:hypothetical protein